MKNRRKFIKSGLIALVTGASAYAGLTNAKEPAKKAEEKIEKPLEKTVFLAGVIYTSDAQGKWKGKDASHAPIVEIKDKKVTITTDHGMSKNHYIVRHTLVTEAGEVVGEKTFSADDEPKSVFDLPDGQTKLYATSFCNKHDLWLTEVTV